MLRNPGFDRDLAGWTLDPQGGRIHWSEIDAEKCAYSGSLRLSFPNQAEPGSFWQCVTVRKSASYSLGAWVRDGPVANGYSYCEVTFHSASDCSGPSLGEVKTNRNDTWDVFVWLTANQFTVPNGTVSGKVKCATRQDNDGPDRVGEWDLIYFSTLPGGY